MNITINDVNDKPRDIRLSNQKVKENAPINTVIGQLTARDEDSGQRLVFTLDNDDNGRFKIDGTGRLLKAKVTDYETSKVHLVTVRATDNGSPRLWVSMKHAGCTFKITYFESPPPPDVLNSSKCMFRMAMSVALSRMKTFICSVVTVPCVVTPVR